MTDGLRAAIAQALRGLGIPDKLAEDLTTYFFQLAREVQTGDLEKSSSGKFVEILVQVFQSLDPQRAGHDASVIGVDTELNETYERRPVRSLPNESRVAIVRIARGIYALRSKRSIVHRNEIDPNLADLECIFQSAQWIMAELVRVSTQLSMEEARNLVAAVQRPIVPFVEVIMGRPLVLRADLSVDDELLLILHNSYSRETPVSRAEIGVALNRRSDRAVRKSIGVLYEKRLIEGGTKVGYRLTKLGVQKAFDLLQQLAAPQPGQISV